mmetsp:Transcript_21998/g.52176  ORF Transcript_21998/g.52176 Transcript_21998/m.52176 type:complete len:350 (-) Transcript_21998:30-1079(-)
MRPVIKCIGKSRSRTVYNSKHEGKSCLLSLGRLRDGDHAAGHGRHDGGWDQGRLHAVGAVGLLGRNASKAEEEDASSKEQHLQQSRRRLTPRHGTCPQSQAGAHIREVAREVRGADGNRGAPSGDAVLDALGEGEEQQRLGVGIVASAVRCLAVVDQAAAKHAKSGREHVGGVAALVDCFTVGLAVACHEAAGSEGGHEVKECGSTVHNQASCVAGVAGLMGDGHAHVDDGQGVDVAGCEAKDVLDHQEGVVVRALLRRASGCGLADFGACKRSGEDHDQEAHEQGVAGHNLDHCRGLLLHFHHRRAAEGLMRLEAPKCANAERQQQSGPHAAADRHRRHCHGYEDGTG